MSNSKQLSIYDFLKPGAKYNTGKVDTNDPVVKRTIEECRKAQKQIEQQRRDNENRDLRNIIITI